MQKKLEWAVFYEYLGINGIVTMPVFGSDDGNFYLGGSRSIGYLLFTTKADALKKAREVRKDKWFKNDKNIYKGSVVVRRFIIEAL